MWWCVFRARGQWKNNNNNECHHFEKLEKLHTSYRTLVCKLSVQKYVFIIHNFNQHNFRSFRSSFTMTLNFTPSLFLSRFLHSIFYFLVQGMQISCCSCVWIDTHAHIHTILTRRTKKIRRKRNHDMSLVCKVYTVNCYFRPIFFLLFSFIKVHCLLLLVSGFKPYNIRRNIVSLPS